MNSLSARIPPHIWFAVSAIFHYLGPSFAVLLFPAIGVLGIAWFRIASAALIFAPVTRPDRVFRNETGSGRLLLIGLGLCLAVMNTSFYLALERLPMSLVAAMEFIGTIGIALYGLRTRRNVVALILTVTGVFVLIDVKWSTDPAGLFWSALNAALFAVYIVLGHKAAEQGAGNGVERLGAAMAIAFLVLVPIGLGEASAAFQSPVLIMAGIGVGICSSVIPYVCDQMAMARLPRASFAMLLAILPATATIIAALVLAQIPTPRDIAGIVLVMLGIALHRPARP
ncbi:MAG: EamA family transporter [Rhodospirillales bacterium]|nr:EamA family transporter [Rhodospirillales bacterium]